MSLSTITLLINLMGAGFWLLFIISYYSFILRIENCSHWEAFKAVVEIHSVFVLAFVVVAATFLTIS